MSYEAVIGLEVHVQLKTATKIFCRCTHRFGAEPNTQICPVCLGYPGTLPVLNQKAVEQAVRLAAALNAQIHPVSVFSRKSYFYADLPKGYQISQFDRPLAEHGRLRLRQHDFDVAITRLHLEEDAGKLLHEAPGGLPLDGESLVDFNRCGAPLLEIVSEPDLRSPEQAADYFQSLHQILLYTDTSEASLEQGHMRCDANVSVRPVGQTELGTRTEIKNLNSFRHVAKAVEYEIQRQIMTVESGDSVRQCTLTWDADRGVTHTLRSKEEAHDYRYCPEPDLPPLQLTADRIAQMSADLPELPAPKRKRFQAERGLPHADADLLSQSPDAASYFERVADAGQFPATAAANWIKTEILRTLKERGWPWSQAPSPERLARLIEMVEDGRTSSTAGKTVLSEMWTHGEDPESLVQRLGLMQERDPEQLERWLQQALDGHPDQLAQLRAGKTRLTGFFVGKVMALSKGKADPRKINELLARVAVSESSGEPEP